MPQTRAIQTNFTSGVLDPRLQGRIDIDQYYNGVKQAENCLTQPQGGIRRRPGTEWVDTLPAVLTQNGTTPTVPNGGTAANLIDNDSSTVSATTVAVGTTDPYVVAHYDLGSATAVRFVDVIGILLDTGSSTEFVVQSSTDNSTWTTRHTFTSITTTAQDVRIDADLTARYWRVARVGTTDLGAALVTIGDFLIWTESSVSDWHAADFEISDTDQYLAVFTDQNIRIFKNDASVIDLPTSYVTADLKEISFAQADVAMVITHEDYPPTRLVRGADDSSWTFENITFSAVPQYDYNDASSPSPTSYICTLTFTNFAEGDRFQIDLDGALTPSIPVADFLTSNGQDAMEESIRKAVQDLYLLGEDGVTVSVNSTPVATITIAGASAGNYNVMVAYATEAANSAAAIAASRTQPGSSRREDLWSAGRGYPRRVTFHQSRLYFGGTKSKPQSLLGSKIGSFFNFDTGKGLDDDAIFVTLNTRTRNSINALVPARALQMFSTGGEFAINAKPITPSSAIPDSQTNHGSSTIQPVEIDGATIFVEKKGRTLREFIFNFNENAFVGPSLSFLAQTLINSPVDMTALKGRSDDDSNYVFIVNSDGSMAIYNTLRSQSVGGFTSWKTPGATGLIVGARVLDDTLYLGVKRTVNGSQKLFLEKMSDNALTDCAVVKTQASSTTVTGLDHLEGETVRVKADGAVMDNATVASGQITLGRAATSVEVGLDYNPTIEFLPYNGDFGSGNNQMRRKKIVRMNLHVFETNGLIIDGERQADNSLGAAGASPLGTVPDPVTDIIDDITGAEGWERLTSPVITQDDPLPMTLLSAEFMVEGS